MYTYARLYVYHVCLHIYTIIFYNGYNMVWLSQRGQAVSILYYSYLHLCVFSRISWKVWFDCHNVVKSYTMNMLYMLYFSCPVLRYEYVIWLSQRGQITYLWMFIDDRDHMYMYIRDMCVVLGLPTRRWRYPSYSVYVTLDTPVPFYARRLKPHYPFYP